MFHLKDIVFRLCFISHVYYPFMFMCLILSIHVLVISTLVLKINGKSIPQTTFPKLWTYIQLTFHSANTSDGCGSHQSEFAVNLEALSVKYIP